MTYYLKVPLMEPIGYFFIMMEVTGKGRACTLISQHKLLCPECLMHEMIDNITGGTTLTSVSALNNICIVLQLVK